ncbi:MAG: hypothetical protein ABJB86_20960 [Bacteroidota bacterium]
MKPINKYNCRAFILALQQPELYTTRENPDSEFKPVWNPPDFSYLSKGINSWYAQLKQTGISISNII